ncbi:ComEA family DNA-binding protein [bacterium]|nr:ComEA family DNA-binding protein [bacterium]
MHNIASYLTSAIVCLVICLHPGKASSETQHSIDINAASAEQLAESLPGIGPAKAARIVQWRKENGAFRSVEQLQEVKGIGEKTVEKLRAYVRIGSAADAKNLWLEEDAREQKVQADVRRILNAATLAATPQAIEQAPQQPWYKRSALQIMRTH